MIEGWLTMPRLGLAVFGLYLCWLLLLLSCSNICSLQWSSANLSKAEESLCTASSSRIACWFNSASLSAIMLCWILVKRSSVRPSFSLSWNMVISSILVGSNSYYIGSCAGHFTFSASYLNLASISCVSRFSHCHNSVSMLLWFLSNPGVPSLLSVIC